MVVIGISRLRRSRGFFVTCVGVRRRSHTRFWWIFEKYWGGRFGVADKVV